METQQLALFGDDQVVGTGQPHPWPTIEPADEAETDAVDPGQLAFGDEDATLAEDAA